MNSRLIYLYRDASNYKQWHEIVIAGELSENAVRETLDQGEWFVPSAVGLPDLQTRFKDQGFVYPTEDDHPWHELWSVSPTEDPPSVEGGADEFMERLAACRKIGWESVVNAALPGRSPE